jgi:hypothetical protein
VGLHARSESFERVLERHVVVALFRADVPGVSA